MKKGLLAVFCMMFALCLFGSEVNPAAKLLDRILSGQSSHFEFVVDTALNPYTFKLFAQNGKIHVAGSEQSAVNAGLGHYLKHYAKIHLSDCGSTLNAPEKWLLPETPFEQTSPAKIRNAYNYCTHSYTFSYYDWPMWERELDRLALNGINLVLVLQGHEVVWQKTLQRLGVSDTDIGKYIPAAPFTAWWLMANLEGEGGPLPQSVIDVEAKIGRKMCDRLRELGMEPIVNGFTGALPSFIPKYVKGHFIPQGEWCGFQRPTVLSPLDPEFARIAAIWYDELHKQFGKVKYYGGDLFHEGGQTGNLDITQCGIAMQEAILRANPDGIYVMQGWHNNPYESMIAPMKKDHILIQQLCLDMATLRNGNFRTYSGCPWIFTEIGNFGGNSGLYGNLQAQSDFPEKLYVPGSGNVVGMGLTAEGLVHNPIVYDLWTDVMWSPKNIDLKTWIKDYAQRRYGSQNADALRALALLNETVYAVSSPQEAVTDFVLSAVPSAAVARARFWCTNAFYWDLKKVTEAAAFLLKGQSNSEGWNYDMTDCIRQVLNGYSYYLRNQITVAYEAKDLSKFQTLSAEFLAIFDDLDAMLATEKTFLLGSHLERVKSRSSDPKIQKQLATALLQLYTTWQPTSGSSLNDYASRSLADLMKGYYKARWTYWLSECEKALKDGKPMPKYDEKKIDNVWYKTVNSETMKMKPEGSTAAIAKRILEKYTHKIIEATKFVTIFEGKLWTLNPMQSQTQELVFDVTNDIPQAGTYEAVVQWKSGPHAFKIEKVQLFSGETLVIEEIHPGYTGLKNKDNAYILKVEKFRSNLEPYTLKVLGSGDGGSHSKGELIFTRR